MTILMNRPIPSRRQRLRLLWQALLGVLALGLVAVDVNANVLPATSQSLDSLRQLAEEYVVRTYGASPLAGKVEATATTLDDRLRLPYCAKPEAFLPDGVEPAARMTVGIRCPQPVWRIYVPVNTRSEASILVARRALARGSRVLPADVGLELRQVAGFANQYVADAAVLEGHSLRQAVAPGTPLTRALLVGEALVKRGQRVALVARAGGIEVQASGEALADALPDGRVRVRNLDTQRILEGRVESRDRVVVGL